MSNATLYTSARNTARALARSLLSRADYHYDRGDLDAHGYLVAEADRLNWVALWELNESGLA